MMLAGSGEMICRWDGKDTAVLQSRVEERSGEAADRNVIATHSGKDLFRNHMPCQTN